MGPWGGGAGGEIEVGSKAGRLTMVEAASMGTNDSSAELLG